MTQPLGSGFIHSSVFNISTFLYLIFSVPNRYLKDYRFQESWSLNLVKLGTLFLKQCAKYVAKTCWIFVELINKWLSCFVLYSFHLSELRHIELANVENLETSSILPLAHLSNQSLNPLNSTWKKWSAIHFFVLRLSLHILVFLAKILHFLLWTELYPCPQIHTLNPKPQCLVMWLYWQMPSKRQVSYNEAVKVGRNPVGLASLLNGYLRHTLRHQGCAA